MGVLKLAFICVALLVVVTSAKKKKFYYETEYSEVHKKSTSIVVSKYKDLHDFSFCSFIRPHKNSKGLQTVFSHYDYEQKTVLAVILDYTKKKIHLQVGEESKEIDSIVKVDEWTHFALTRSSQNGEFDIYVGGRRITTIRNYARNYVFRSRGSLAIAQYQVEKSRYREAERFVGKISEANFYSKKLTESQVTKLSQYEEVEELETEEVISWSKSFGQDGQTKIGPSSVPGYAKTCKKKTVFVSQESHETSSSSSGSSSSESSASGSSSESGSHESGPKSHKSESSSESGSHESGSKSHKSESSQTKTKEVCTLDYDLVFSEAATEAVAEPQNVHIEHDLAKLSTSSYSYVEDTSKESTFISYATDSEEESFSLGQKGGRFLLRVGSEKHYLEEQTTVIKSKEWASFGISWVSETGVVKVYQNGKKIGVFKNVRKGKKFSKKGAFVVGQRQTTKQKYEKESRCHGRVSRVYVIQDELTEQEFKQMSSRTESFTTKKTTLISSATTTYSFSGLSQFTETTLTESSSSSQQHEHVNEAGHIHEHDNSQENPSVFGPDFDYFSEQIKHEYGRTSVERESGESGGRSKESGESR